jgi:hypothetical protein
VDTVDARLRTRRATGQPLWLAVGPRYASHATRAAPQPHGGAFSPVILLMFSDALVFAELRGNLWTGKLTKKETQEVERVTALAARGEISSQNAGSTLRNAHVLPIEDVSHVVLTRSYLGVYGAASAERIERSHECLLYGVLGVCRTDDQRRCAVGDRTVAAHQLRVRSLIAATRAFDQRDVGARRR